MINQACLLKEKKTRNVKRPPHKNETGDNGVTIIKNIGFTREGYKNHHYIGVIELFPT